MKNKIIKFLFIFLLVIIIMPSPSYATDKEIPATRQLPRLVDDAFLLTEEENSKLLEKLDEISERQNLDVVVITISSMGGSSPMEYADDVYDYVGYGMGENKDGILLLLSLEEGDWWISTHGFGVTAFTDAGIDYMSDIFLKDLRNERYFAAFGSYGDLADDFISQAKKGEAYDVGNLPKGSVHPMWLILSFIPGGIFGFILTGNMKRKLKSVVKERVASNYISLSNNGIANVQDLFLYRNITKTRRVEKEESTSGGSVTHTSSSGRSHGGKGGKF